MDDPLPPDPAATTTEDYVHIEDPNPNVESLGESFVGVEDDASEDEDRATSAAATNTRVIQLQGDQRKNVSTFLVQGGILKKDHIKIHGF